jgi:hypothetical protein
MKPEVLPIVKTKKGLEQVSLMILRRLERKEPVGRLKFQPPDGALAFGAPPRA